MEVHSLILHGCRDTEDVGWRIQQQLTAPEQTYKILSVFGDNPPANVQALKSLAKTHQKSPMARRELISEINRLCLPIPELNRCPHTPDLFE